MHWFDKLLFWPIYLKDKIESSVKNSSFEISLEDVVLDALLVLLLFVLIKIWVDQRSQGSDEWFVRVMVRLLFAFTFCLLFGGLLNIAVFVCNRLEMPTLTPENYYSVCFPWLADYIPSWSSGATLVLLSPGKIASPGDLLMHISMLLIYWLGIATVIYSLLKVANRIVRNFFNKMI